MSRTSSLLPRSPGARAYPPFVRRRWLAAGAWLVATALAACGGGGGAGDASNVTLEHRAFASETRRQRFELTLRNANPFAVRFEGEFDIDENAVKDPSTRFARKNGRNLWVTTVPANGTQNLRYTVIVQR